MLHELLLALHGHHGQLFYLQGVSRGGGGDEGRGDNVLALGGGGEGGGGGGGPLPTVENGTKLKVNVALPLFHPAELAILQDLLSVATEYGKIEEFILAHKDADREKEDAKGKIGNHRLQGLYIEALCEGLSQVLLPYRQALVDLERSILNNSSSNISGCGDGQLSFIQHRIMPYQPVLSSVNSLIKQLFLHKAHGCYILDIIYKASCSGVGQIKDAMKLLLFEGHKVMYKQLLAWILQGSLFDPFNEFFINAVEAPSTGTTNKSVLSSHSTFMSEHSIIVNVPQTSKLNYRLNAAMVPSHISIQLAEKIFFIGESILLFEADRKLDEQGSVLRERETEFYLQLAQLRDQPEFRAPDFERFVDSIRESASRHLHTLVLQRADLKEELMTARNFFLLGRGELFQAFVNLADKYLQRPVSATTQHDVNQSFLSACRSILPDDEVISKKIKVLVQQPPTQAYPLRADETTIKTEEADKSSKVIGWRCLSLQYSVPWPLHLILSEKALESYNRVFQFLITAKRTQLALHNVWADQMARKTMSSNCELRTHMTFVVDNLQQYFMADVLESQYAILVRKLDQSTNFEELRQAHDEFLSAVTTLTFINNKPVNQCLNELLSSCLFFCRALDLPEDGTRERSIANIGLAFGRQSGFLFQLLSSLRSQTVGTHLAQLLLRINFNRFFSKHGHVGKIV